MSLKELWHLLKTTVSEWSEDKAPRLAAALAYYTAFSLAPVLVIAIAVAGLVFGQEAVQGRVIEQISALAGEQGAVAVQTMVEASRDQGASILATVVGIAVLLFAASGVFGQLQDALNTMWEVKPKPDRGLVGLIKDRFFSFTMVLGVGFLLLVSLVLSAILAAVGEYFLSAFPGFEILIQVLNFIVSFGVITLLFALIFKFLPDAEVAWRDVWLGAAFTAFLFLLGQFAISLYIGNTDFSQVYGAAGSIVVILLWVYYSAQILLFGAEFTQVYANQHGSRIVPAEHAIPVSEEERNQQGIPRKETVAAATASGVSLDEAARGASSQQEARETVPPEQRSTPVLEPLPPARPPLLVFSAVLATLVGFIGGMVVKRGGRQ